MKQSLLLVSLAMCVVYSGCVTPPTACTQCDTQCVDLKADSRNCGSCGSACSAGSVCRDGACALSCQTSLTACGASCVDAKNDSNNCGGCGKACTAGQVCQAGACTTACPSGQVACGGACVTLNTDDLNCGACGMACPMGSVCKAGACEVQCQPNQLSCNGGACVNAQTDNANCGSCGTTCTAGQVCNNGTCGTTCGGSLTTCTSGTGVRSCADTMTDNANCGGCGNACGAGLTCAAGSCVPSCRANQNLCGAACTNLQTDNTNCGACGTACATGQSCQAGACLSTCLSGQSLCGADAGVGGTCSNQQTDPTNCGACGVTCTAGQACVSGACTTSCGGSNTICTSGSASFCANLTRDNANCGMCGLACGAGTACVSGQCTTTCGNGNSLCTAMGNSFCTNLGQDNANCGMCGQACGAAESCVSGTCRPFCGAGTSVCPGANGSRVCANFTNDNANCGACGVTCSGATACAFGTCVASTNVTTALNLSTDNLPGRTCTQGGEMVRYSVTALTGTTATVSVAPAAGCLNVGDELLLINLQGTAAARTNVGNYELLKVASVAGSTVTFQTSKTKFYGTGAADDLNLGTARTNQRVMLQRVPFFNALSVSSTGSLTGAAWDGVSGGVFAVRAAVRVQLAGALDMSRKGYDGAASTTTIASTGRQGESIGGLGAVDDRNNFGAGGGGRGDLTGCGGISNGVAGGGGGHATWGGRGAISTCGGAGGAPVGSTTLSRIFLGSGGSAGGSDDSLLDNPPGGAGGRGGGIVMVLTPSLELTATVDVSGAPGQGDAPGTNCTAASANHTSTTACWDNSGPGGGGAGGSFFTSASFFLGRGALRFAGGLGGDGGALLVGSGGRGSAGRVFPLPVNCYDVSGPDGEYTFAFGGDSSQPYQGYCAGMASGAPRMYLTLPNQQPTQNYALWDGTQWGSQVLTTRFQRVRFDPNTRRISPIDYTFSTSTGRLTGGPAGTNVFTQFPYGNAADCDRTNGRANIDLRGLPLAISGNNVWTISGNLPVGSATPSIDRQVIALVGGGACGDIRPTTFNGEIELSYLAPRASCLAEKTAVPAATDGFYALAPDPSVPTLGAYCDMANGGWALLQDNGAGSGNAGYGEAMPVVPGTASYAPLSMARLLATGATQVNVRTTGQFGVKSFVTVANASPIVNLRDGQILNFNSSPRSDYTLTGSFPLGDPLNTGCTPALRGWPNVYHACNNGNGFHWLNDIGRWVNSTMVDDPLQVWVK